MTPTESTVYVIDDDPAARESVAALVKSKGLRARTFASAEDFLAALDGIMRGCLVVDFRMTGMSGLDLQQRLNRDKVPLPIIIITGHGTVPMAVQAMRAGALTFLEKPCSDQELWNHIRAALELEGRAHEQKVKRDEIASRMATLTPDERTVMDRLVAGRPNKQIASELDLGLRTVELRRANIMKKMHANSLADLVRFALILEQSSGA
jgi:FixJ family two-component response regulator